MTITGTPLRLIDEGLNCSYFSTVNGNIVVSLTICVFKNPYCAYLDFLPEGEFGLLVEELSPGRALRQLEDTAGAKLSPELQEQTHLNGELLKLTFNHFDILRPIRQIQRAHLTVSQTTEIPQQSIGRVKAKANTISLNSEQAFAQYPIEFTATEPFQLYVKFKTIASSGLLLALVSNSSTTTGTLEIVASLELIRGKIRYRFGQTTVIAPDSTKKKRQLNDLKWHTISIKEVSMSFLKLSVNAIRLMLIP